MSYIFHLKLRRHLAMYVRAKYGTPATFQDGTHLYNLLCTHLRSNLKLSHLTDLCYNDFLFSQPERNIGIELPRHQLLQLSREERGQYVSIAMPMTVASPVYGERRTSPYWQLGVAGARKLRHALNQEFWMDFARYTELVAFQAECIGRSMSVDERIERFLCKYGIDGSEYDNIRRDWMRNKSQFIRTQMEQRALMEAEVDFIRHKVKQRNHTQHVLMGRDMTDRNST